MTPRVPSLRPQHVHQRQTGGGGAAGPRRQKAPPECHAAGGQRHTSPPRLYWHKHQRSLKIMGERHHDPSESNWLSSLSNILSLRRNNHRWLVRLERYATQLCLQSNRQPMWKLFSYANQSVTTNYLCIVDRKKHRITSCDCFQNKDLRGRPHATPCHRPAVCWLDEVCICVDTTKKNVCSKSEQNMSFPTLCEHFSPKAKLNLDKGVQQMNRL